MSSAQTTSLLLDIDSVCNALHVGRDAFVKAATRSAAADAAAASAAASTDLLSPLTGGGYGSVSNYSSSVNNALPAVAVNRSHLSAVSESDSASLLPAGGSPSLNRLDGTAAAAALGGGRNAAPQHKRLTAKTLEQHVVSTKLQHSSQPCNQHMMHLSPQGVAADPASDAGSQQSSRRSQQQQQQHQNVRQSLASETGRDGAAVDDVHIVIPADVHQILEQQQQQQQHLSPQQQHLGQPIASNFSRGSSLCGPQQPIPTGPLASTMTILTDREFAIEADGDGGTLRLRFADDEEYEDDDDDDDNFEQDASSNYQQQIGSGTASEADMSNNNNNNRSSLAPSSVAAVPSANARTLEQNRLFLLRQIGEDGGPTVSSSTIVSDLSVSANNSSSSKRPRGSAAQSLGAPSSSSQPHLRQQQQQQQQNQAGEDEDGNDNSINSNNQVGAMLPPPRSALQLPAVTNSQRQFQKEKRKKRKVMFTEDVIDRVKVEHDESGGVLVKVSFRRPPWIFYALAFSVIIGAVGWLIVVVEANRATPEDNNQQWYALLKITAVRSWSMLLTAIIGIVFVFPPRSSDAAFARDPANIMRILIVALLNTGAVGLMCLSLRQQELAISPLLYFSLLPATFVVASRYGLSVLNMSSAFTSWHDVLCAAVALAVSLALPLRYSYSGQSVASLALAAGAAFCSSTYTWKAKSLRPYFSQGVVVLTVALLCTIVFTVPLITIPALQQVQVPFFGPANYTSKNSSSGANSTIVNTTTAPNATTLTSTTTPSPTGYRNNNNGTHHIMALHMDADSFILALISGVCEALRLFSQGMVSGFLEVPSILSLSMMGAPLFQMLFAAVGLQGVGVIMSVATSVATAMAVCAQWYYGEGYRRETHLHLAAAPASK